MNTFKTIAYWAPRITGILLIIYISLFALDTPPNGNTVQYITDLARHLIPSALLITILVLAWRWEWTGALSYAVLGIVYVIVASDRPDWILAIAGPLFLCAILFGISWYYKRQSISIH